MKNIPFSKPFDASSKINESELRKLLQLKLPEGFSRKSLSIFDHWLTHEECISQPMFFQQFQEKEEDLVKFLDFEKRFYEALLAVSHQHQLFIISGTADSELGLIENAHEFKMIVSSSLREQGFKHFLFPEIGVVLFGNFDLTWPFYFKIEPKGFIKEFADRGIFILV